MFNFLKEKKLIFNFFVSRNWKKLSDSHKRAKILADNRKGHQPIETLISETPNFKIFCWGSSKSCNCNYIFLTVF